MTSNCSPAIVQPEIDEPRGGRWIALSRDVRAHPIVGFGQPVKPADPKRGAYSRFEAWVDLLMEVCWKARQVANKGKTILLERGEMLAARKWLAERWNWSEMTVRWFLDKLESESMIARKSNHSDSRLHGRSVGIVSVCNYERYQTRRDLEHLLGNPLGNHSTTTQQPHPYKETIHTENSASAHEFPEGDFVKVNGEAIYVSLMGKRLKFEYGSIDQWAALNLCPQDKARQIVEAEARGWVADQQWPQTPSRWLQKQIQNWRVHKAIAETRIENAGKAYAGRGGYRKSRDVNEMTAAEYEAYLERGNV